MPMDVKILCLVAKPQLAHCYEERSWCSRRATPFGLIDESIAKNNLWMLLGEWSCWHVQNWCNKRCDVHWTPCMKRETSGVARKFPGNVPAKIVQELCQLWLHFWSSQRKDSATFWWIVKPKFPSRSKPGQFFHHSSLEMPKGKFLSSHASQGTLFTDCHVKQPSC